VPRTLLVLAVSCLVVGCGDETPQPPAAERRAAEPPPARRGQAAPSALVRPVTPAVPRFCARAARRADRVAVRCPAVLPAGGYELPRAFGHGRCQWLANLEPRRRRGRGPAGIFHVLVGGTCGGWADLAAAPGTRWPRTRPAGDRLRLIGPADGGLEPPTVLRRVTVAGRPALLLRAAPYPAGGIHGDHLVLVFDVEGDGHLVSGHAGHDGPTPATPATVQALVEVAASMQAAPPAPAAPQATPGAVP
jgi:hypothetical protein